MDTITVNVCDLTPHPKNPRKHGEKQLLEYQRSIQMFGQIRPVVIDENNQILCGHGIVLSFQAMGIKTCSALVVKGLDELGKVKLMLADNKIQELGLTSYGDVNSLIVELSLSEVPGFDESILLQMLADTDKLLDEWVEDKRPSIPADNFFETSSPQQANPVNHANANHDVSNDAISPMIRRQIQCPHCGEMIEL